MYVRNIETPLLLIHSEDDMRCPISQADEMFTALRNLKKTAVMVRFPGENHNLPRSGKPLHRVERLEYIVAWFDTYMGPGDDYSVPLAEPAKVVLKLPKPFPSGERRPPMKKRPGRQYTSREIWAITRTLPANSNSQEPSRRQGSRLKGGPDRPFTVDFLVDEWLIVEVDGWSHLTSSRQSEDRKRQTELESWGFR